MISLPRLLNGDMSQKETLHPSKTSISRNAFALSTAAVTLPDGEPSVKARDWIKLFDRYGTAGIFRVSRVRNSYGNQMSLSLKHGFCVLGDDTVKESEGTLTGTAEQIIRQLWEKTGVTESPRYWTFGSFAQTPVITYEYSNPKLLTAVYDVLKKVPGYDFIFDQSVFPWVFSLVKLNDSDACEGRFGRNLDSCIVDVDDSALCTRAYLDDRDGYTDADSANEWGIVSETLSVPDGADDAAVQEYVQAYLRDHGEPYVSITLSGVDMSAATGETIDRFETGSICRACLADYGVTVRSRIVTLETPDVYGKPDDVRVVMANRANTASDLLARLRNSTNALGDRVTVTNRRVGGVSTKLENTDIELIRTKEELTDTRYRLSKAGLVIDGDADFVKVFAYEETTDLLDGRLQTAEAVLTVQAEEISSKVSKDGVISSINQTAEAIRIQAKRIDLSGYVTVSELDAAVADITIAFSNTVATDTLEANSAIIGYMMYQDEYCTWKSRTVQTSIPDFTKATITLSNGNSVSVVTGWATAPSSLRSTINYLGQE